MRYLASLMLAASLCGMPAILGCDKEVSREETVKTNSDGTQKKTETTVTKNPDGTMNTSTETKRTTTP